MKKIILAIALMGVTASAKAQTITFTSNTDFTNQRITALAASGDVTYYACTDD